MFREQITDIAFNGLDQDVTKNKLLSIEIMWIFSPITLIAHLKFHESLACKVMRMTHYSNSSLMGSSAMMEQDLDQLLIDLLLCQEVDACSE